ncbi:MAG: response regulator [Magnetovibrionaceae bacterium]
MTPYCLDQLTVLILDPNAFSREITKRILTTFRLGTILEAASIEQADFTLKTATVDLILTEWALSAPDGPPASSACTGADYVRQIRRIGDSCNRFIPVIMLTSYTEERYVRFSRDAGVHTFLAKPVSPKALYGRICALIGDDRDFVSATSFAGPDRRFRHLAEVAFQRRLSDPTRAEARLN